MKFRRANCDSFTAVLFYCLLVCDAVYMCRIFSEENPSDMEQQPISETSVCVYQTTLHYSLADSTIQK